MNTTGTTNMRLLRRFGNFFDHTLNVMTFVGSVLLLCMVLLVSVAVVFRYFLGRPIGWVIEICQYNLVCVTFLVVAWVLRREGHVKMDLVLNYLDTKPKAILNTLTSSISTIVCIILTLFAIRVTWELFQSDYFTPTILMVPKFIFISFMAFGLLVLSIQFMRRTYGFLKSWRSQISEERKV